MAKLLIGTSGWHYASWKGRFYPPKLRLKDRLKFYATTFPTTELNGVFYRTPTMEAVTSWREQTPDDFCFAWKASKFITHWKRLSDRSDNSLKLLESRLSLLGEKAGPVLFQLPPQFTLNFERLAGFLTARWISEDARPEEAICVRIPARKLVHSACSALALR